MAPIVSETLATTAAGLLVAGLSWLALRIKRYGNEALVNHRKRKKAEDDQRLQLTVDAVLETLTKTNGGSSTKDALNDIRSHQTKTDELHAEFRKEVRDRLENMQTDISNVTTLVINRPPA